MAAAQFYLTAKKIPADLSFKIRKHFKQQLLSRRAMDECEILHAHARTRTRTHTGANWYARRIDILSNLPVPLKVELSAFLIDGKCVRKIQPVVQQSNRVVQQCNKMERSTLHASLERRSPGSQRCPSPTGVACCRLPVACCRTLRYLLHCVRRLLHAVYCVASVACCLGLPGFSSCPSSPT